MLAKLVEKERNKVEQNKHGHKEMPKKFGPTIAERISSRDMGEVFGYRLMGTMDEYIVKAIEIRLNQFVTGITDGLVRFIDEAAKDAAERHVSLQISRVNDETKAKIEVAPPVVTQDTIGGANSVTGQDETGQTDTEDMDTNTSLNDNSEHNNRPNDVIFVPSDFYPKYGEKGWIDWAGSSPDTRKQIIMFFMRKAEKEKHIDITIGKNFKNLGPDYNGCYQRAAFVFDAKRRQAKRGEAWNVVVDAYRKTVFEVDKMGIQNVKFGSDIQISGTGGGSPNGTL